MTFGYGRRGVERTSLSGSLRPAGCVYVCVSSRKSSGTRDVYPEWRGSPRSQGRATFASLHRASPGRIWVKGTRGVFFLELPSGCLATRMEPQRNKVWPHLHKRVPQARGSLSRGFPPAQEGRDPASGSRWALSIFCSPAVSL